MTWRADLRELSDNALLARLRPLPQDSAERAAICAVLVERYAHLGWLLTVDTSWTRASRSSADFVQSRA